MTNRKVSDLTLLAGASLAQADLLYVVDVDAPVGQQGKKTTVADLALAMSLGVFQPLDTQLTSLANLVYAGNELKNVRVNAAGTGFELAATASSFDGTFASLTGIPTTLAGYGITDAQALDATLTNLAAQNWSLNSVPVGTGADTVAQVSLGTNTVLGRASTGNVTAKTVTDFAFTLFDDADAAAMRTTLGVDPAGSSTLTAANEVTDVTCFPLFATNATGTVTLKTNTALTFNSATAELGSTKFTGALNGTVGATTPATGAFTTLGRSGKSTYTVAVATNGRYDEIASTSMGDGVNFAWLKTSSHLVHDAQDYYDDVVAWGMNCSDTVGVPLDSAKPMAWFALENKFYNGSEFGSELHLSIKQAGAGITARAMSFFLPHTGSTSTAAAVGFAVNTIAFNNYAGTSKAQWNLKDSILDLTTQHVVRANINNYAVLVQKNAANDAFVNLPFINGNNQIEFQSQIAPPNSGTASAPTYCLRTDDSNTGWYQIGADAQAWSCGGTERMRLTGAVLGLTGISINMTGEQIIANTDSNMYIDVPAGKGINFRPNGSSQCLLIDSTGLTLSAGKNIAGVADITGGASSMTITAGTGNSRTLTFKTTTSGGTATAALTLNADQSATLFPSSGPVITHTPSGDTNYDGYQFGLSSLLVAETNGPGGQTNYTDSTWGIGINVATAGSGRIDATKPSLGLTWESKWYQGGSFQTEFHLQGYGTDNNSHRIMSFQVPHDGLGLNSNVSFNLGQFIIGDWAGSAQFAVTDPTSNFYAGTAAALTVPDAVAGNVLWSISGPTSLTGNLELFHATAGASGDAQVKLLNTGAGGTLLYLQTTSGSGDPRIQFSASGSDSWTTGLDNSDSDKFKISRGEPGTNTVITCDAASLTTLGGALVVTGAITPSANDVGAIGAAALGFSDAFFASGAVLNFGNGDLTETHSSGLLTNSGSYSIGGTLTVAGNTTLTNATSAVLNLTKTGTNAGTATITNGGVLTITSNSGSDSIQYRGAAHSFYNRGASVLLANLDATGLSIGTGGGAAQRLSIDSPAGNGLFARFRNGTATRYRSDLDIGAGGLTFTIFDDTGAAYLPIVFNCLSMSILDAANVILGTTTGTKIGTGTNQMLAFHNATPVVQRASSAQTAVVTTASTQTTPWGFATQAQADAIVTLVNELRAALVEKGLIKGSA